MDSLAYSVVWVHSDTFVATCSSCIQNSCLMLISLSLFLKLLLLSCRFSGRVPSFRFSIQWLLNHLCSCILVSVLLVAGYWFYFYHTKANGYLKPFSFINWRWLIKMQYLLVSFNKKIYQNIFQYISVGCHSIALQFFVIIL